MALEICTQTFDMAGEIKLHAHLVLEFDGKKYIRNPMTMRLAGALPAHPRQADTGTSRHSRSKAPMHYYLQCGKKGLRVLHHEPTSL